jgi:hypothetical protein
MPDTGFSCNWDLVFNRILPLFDQLKEPEANYCTTLPFSNQFSLAGMFELKIEFTSTTTSHGQRSPAPTLCPGSRVAELEAFNSVGLSLPPNSISWRRPPTAPSPT